ncbi:MAG: serine/threonine protein kinase [Kofleriaceae bacterium]
MLGTLGKYRLDQRLGGGGMAEVFLASTMGAEGFSRKVAIKRVLPGFSDNDAFARMFIDEAQISSQLVHPNIVSVLDFDRDAESRLFLVMELVEGKDLDALVGTGLLPFPVVIYVIGEVLRGLGYAHDLPVGTQVRGVVHRDVSPHNVLLSWEGAVKVSDFGIAKARAASEATASVFIKGKPAYMSPEQANGQALDGRSDLFAVGIMLWEMVVGRRLFVGNDTRATLAAVLFGQIPRPRSLRPDVPKDLERVVMKLLERDLPARYATAEDALAELLECADAPRAGREALTGVLVERFGTEAKVRQSLVRARSIPGQRAPTPSPLPISSQPTISAPGSAAPLAMPAAAIPSLGAVMNAPTGTIEPTRVGGRGTLGKVLLLIAAIGGSAVATFLIVSAVASKRSSPAGTGSATGSGAAPAPMVATAAPDAGATPTPPPDAPTAPPAPDAEVATVPPDAAPEPLPPAGDPPPGRSRPEDRREAPKKPGQLTVPGNPSYTVYEGKKKHGDSPFTIQLSAGTHRLRFVNADLDYDKTLTVAIRPGETTTFKPPRK